jgi:polysaccharide chain length determinant protein (PEP-CTERM system associated)
MQDIRSSLRDYLRIVFYWRGTIAVLFFVIVITAVAGSFLWPPTYEGITTMLVEAPSENVVLNRPAAGAPAVPQPVSLTEAREQLAKTQSEVIRSRFLLSKVVDELSLYPDITGPMKRERSINRLQKKISVSLVRDTNLIKITAEDRLSTRSADIVNSLAKFYMEWASEAKRTRAKGAYSFLGTQAQTVEKELRQLEDALQKLKETKGVLALNEQTKLTVEQLGIFDTEYNKALSAEEETLARVNEVKNELSKQKEMIITSTDITTNPVINALKIKLVDLEIRLIELRNKYTDENPLVIGAQEEIEEVKNKLTTEVAKVFGTETTSTNIIYQDLFTKLISLETDLNAYQAKKKALQVIRNEYAKKLTNLSEAELEYTRLLRRIKGKEALYMALLEKQGEAGLTEALENSLIVNVKVIDSASPPVKPARPKKLLNTILGLIVGAIAGVSGAFLRDYWDHSLKTVSQVVKYVGLPVLGVIPRVSAKKAVPYRFGTSAAESYSSLRTALLKITKERPIKTILVTSANNLEGKSITAANLAISIAQLKDVRLLLTDMNLRQPSVHKLFELNSYMNLSELLRRRMGDMFNGIGAENFNIITVGEIPDDPTRVLTSAELKYFLKEARSRFDLVLLDSSSIIPYTDSTILAHEVDAVLLVIKAGASRREVVERARHVLNVPPEKLLGVVLNSVEHVIPEGLYKRL